MKRIIIIVEGDTEKEFVSKVLGPYLYEKGVMRIDCFKIKHSKGGLNKYHHLKKDVIKCVYESNAVVTTLIDYYALPTDFPEYENARKITNKNDKLTFLEDSIKKDIEKEKAFPNLIPYIQLHEFEALVFSSFQSISSMFDNDEINLNEIKSIIDTFPNPEDINNGRNTAPSKRLKKAIKGYQKVIDGIIIIEETGLQTIMDKCPRFKNWVDSLIEKSR